MSTIPRGFKCSRVYQPEGEIWISECSESVADHFRKVEDLAAGVIERIHARNSLAASGHPRDVETSSTEEEREREAKRKFAIDPAIMRCAALDVVREFLERSFERSFPTAEVERVSLRVVEHFDEVFNSYEPYPVTYSPEIALSLHVTCSQGSRYIEPELRAALNELDEAGTGLFSSLTPELDDD